MVMNLKRIKDYLLKRQEICMAFVFGSEASRSAGLESDLDIAVYFRPTGEEIEWECQAHYPEEDRIWLDLEKLAGREVDLLVLNRAASTIADTVLREGKPLFIRDKKIYLDFLLRVSLEAEDYREFVEDFYKMKHAEAS
jgi:predicted nucleotidyltransferase